MREIALLSHLKRSNIHVITYLQTSEAHRSDTRVLPEEKLQINLVYFATFRSIDVISLNFLSIGFLSARV